MKKERPKKKADKVFFVTKRGEKKTTVDEVRSALLSL